MVEGETTTSRTPRHAPSASAPEVTVIIPTRDRAAFLAHALRDVRRQLEVDLEVVVVDDASADADTVAGMTSGDPRIRLVRHSSPRGVAAARNTGIANARGIWLAFLDDDDRWTPSKLRQQLDAAARADAAWVYSGALTLDEDDTVVAEKPPPEEPSIQALLRQANPIPGGCSNVVARAHVVRDVGGFDEELALIADWDLWIRLADTARPARCTELHVGYRLHADNMHIRLADELDAELDHLAAKHATTLPPARSHPDLLIWHARAYKRGGHPWRAARIFARRWRMTHDPVDLRRAVGSLLGERVTGALRPRAASRRESAVARFG